MAETIREMISEEKVDERIRELGRQIKIIKLNIDISELDLIWK